MSDHFKKKSVTGLYVDELMVSQRTQQHKYYLEKGAIGDPNMYPVTRIIFI